MGGVTTTAGALSSRESTEIDNTLAVRLIGDAWITFVTKSLTTADTLGHPEISEELARLEASDELVTLRSQRDREIRQLLSELLGSPLKARALLCGQKEIALRALALDRIQSTTFKFVEAGRPDREAPTTVIRPLLELFHHLLLDDDREESPF